MKPPPPADWRAWLYAIAWLAGGVALTAMSIWLVVLVRYDWPAGTEEQRLGILGVALYMTLTGPLLVMIGLGLRNAIRNLKGSAGVASFEIDGHDGNDPGAVVTTTTETKVTP
jgi:hypothetical protein